MEESFEWIFEVPGVVKPYMDLIVTPQEIELVRRLGSRPRSVPEIAELLGTDIPEAQKLVDSAYHRAVLNKTREDADKYVSATLYDRLGYFTQYEQEVWQSIPKPERTVIDDWYIGEYTDRIAKKVEEDGKNFYRDDVLPIRQALELMEEVEKKTGKPYYVVPCNCRTTTNACHFSIDTCISNGDAPNTQWDRGYGRRLTMEETRALMLSADKEGLMHTVSPRGHVCNCETCCCYEFRAALRLGTKGLYPRVAYVARWEADKCTHCGICSKRCHFRAFERDAGTRKVAFDPKKCWGCGICECTCPRGAIRMIRLEDAV
jgi:Pyruvate/2-oxoacid:ferredoxin oxidoreductase delta subunit